jgi:hypothetical protein
VIRKFFFIIAVLILCGCGAQYTAETRQTMCIDGVEYLVFRVDTRAESTAPHLHRDGKPYTCPDPTVVLDNGL